MVLSATLTLRLDSPEAVRILAGALGPEAEVDLPRSTVALRQDGDRLLLLVEAEDVASLRAAVNSYLRWCATALDVASALPATD
ncbi:MAG TPA: KEOPS complex subunit Pcc1 [Candidatus Thermoplasmatota archaeon]|nr:KEOPS complex subunit Pcc1 [Candidatus Thermoplasmatota archaeon]